MNDVDPIKDLGKVKDIENYLKRTSERNYMLFITGINTALRISDLRILKVKDVRNKQLLKIQKIDKTDRYHVLQINIKLRRAFKKYCKDKHPDDYLFQSRNGINQPIGRGQSYNVIHEVGLMFGLDNISPHSLRKTYGYHFYKQTNDVVTLQKILGHRSPKETLEYIGIEQENVNEAMKGFSI